MSTTSLYLTGSEPLIRGICSAAFPAYAGRTFKLETADTVDIRSYWSGGSRDYFVFVDLASLQASIEIPSNGNDFDPSIRGAERVMLPDGIACVRHSIFCGKDSGLTIIVNTRTMNPSLLPVSVELSRDEQIVLIATRSYKNTYAGRSNVRFLEAAAETGIPSERWEAAKASCIARKLLTAQNSITTEGKNAVGSRSLGRDLADPGFRHRFDPPAVEA